MATTSSAPTSRRRFFAAVSIATGLAIALRVYGLTAQVVLDDEWHAIHKLAASSYVDILRTFGLADHSIPLTLFYKAMAEMVGLAEGRLRALQVLCGVALIPGCAWLAWRAAGDAPAAVLFTFLVSGAPFLVMWSRFARPYSITLLLVVLCIAAIWRWRRDRSPSMAACAAASASLAAWFHPLSGMYAAIACLFVFVEDLRQPAAVRSNPAWQSFALGIAVAASMALPLAYPLYWDRSSLSGKAGGDHPDLATIERMLAIVWGGVPTAVAVIACAVAVWGAVVLHRRDPRLTLYLVLLGTIPGTILALSGAVWIHGGQNFLRYQLPLQPLLLFFGSIGAIALARAAFTARAEGAAWIASAGLSVAYLAATPAIAQVATLGPWYAHIGYHWDYRYRWMVTMKGDRAFDPPEFYHRLGGMPPGAATIVEAPFIWEAPHNPLAYYATRHRQREFFGMIYDLCLSGDRLGEPPPDRRFRFRRFVFVHDVQAVRQSGARYLLLHRRLPHHVGPTYEDARCMANLTRLYGAPIELDDRLAVFDLKADNGVRKLQ